MARRRRTPKLRGVNLRQLEASHAARVRTLLEPLREIVDEQLLPNLETFVSESQTRTDDATDIISAVFGRVRVAFAARFSKTLTERELERSADQVAAAGRDVHRRQLRTVLGVDPIQAEPWLERETNAFVAENASLITTLPDEAIADVEQMVFREGRRGASVTEIRRKIREVDPPKPSTRVTTLAQMPVTKAEKRHADPATLSSQLRGDLDWIIMKALDKDRNRLICVRTPGW